MLTPKFKGTISQYLQDHGIRVKEKQIKKPWSDRETELLIGYYKIYKKMYPEFVVALCCRQLSNRSYQSIADKLKELKAKRLIDPPAVDTVD
jgi:hypothetical protein